MASIERVIKKIVIIQFVLLIVIQGTVHQINFLKEKNPLLLYEGASGHTEMAEEEIFFNQE